MPEPDSSTSPAVYIHIPFCLYACPYCNFNFRLLKNYNANFIDAYVDALISQWKIMRETYQDKRKVYSIYFGGGTPSLLSGKQIKKIIQAINPEKKKDLEISLETNPDGFQGKDLNNCLQGFLDAGINRLSVGVQSFQDKILSRLGRTHDSAQVKRLIQSARKIGFSNISCDFMGSVPDQTLEDFLSDIEAFIQLNVEHISYYSLTLEEKTLFHVLAKKNKISLPPEKIQLAFLETLKKKLEMQGFIQYEISNYAKKTFISQHNQSYWQFRDYYGLGAGAHSFFFSNKENHRSSNMKDPKKFVKVVNLREKFFDFEEIISGKKAMGEFVFTGLRQLEGVSQSHFREKFQEDLENIFSDEIKNLQEMALLEVNKDFVKLTDKGLFVSDTVFEYFV